MVAQSTNDGLESTTTLALRGEDIYAMAAQLRNPIAIDYSIIRVVWDIPLP